ncbi:MASE1 domain-containing protein [Cupriavidus sp. WS]|uniref:MASE1 domain-containing protein n=1 Tax=Cupriavidus sp. WS TaxID=1312922 RepID=UPI000373E53D|nr:MASE1 domain-containing protein [Cupriavidus sp. WS]
MNASNRAVILFLWAALYFCSGYVSHQLNGPFYATGYIWLPAGVTTAAFMLRPMPRWLPVGLAFFAAQLLLGWVEGRDTLRLVLFSLDEIGFAALGVALVRRAQFSLEGLVFVRALLIAGVASSAASAAVGAAWFLLLQDVPFWRTWRVWAAADLVGVLIVLPVLAGWSRFRAARSGGMSRADFLSGLGAFAALALTAFFIFDHRILLPVQSGVAFALTYIPLFLAAVVTLLWGGRGGSVAVAILALFVLYNTSQGDGPFAERSLNHGRSLLEAQLYLAVAALLTLLISTLRTSREQLLAQSARSQNDVKLALAASAQLVYCLDPRSGTLRWSGDLAGLLGVREDAFRNLDDVLAHVHDDDRAQVRGRWLRESDGEQRTDMLFKLMLPAGGSTLVLDMSGPLLDGDESVAVIAGAWRLQPADVLEERDAA